MALDVFENIWVSLGMLWMSLELLDIFFSRDALDVFEIIGYLWVSLGCFGCL